MCYKGLDRAGRVISGERLNQIETRPRSGAQLFGRAYEEHKTSPLSVVDPSSASLFVSSLMLWLCACATPRREVCPLIGCSQLSPIEEGRDSRRLAAAYESNREGGASSGGQCR
jgi:hypothetical protein